MANLKSSERSARVTERNRIQNRPLKSTIKTQITKTQKLIEGQDIEAAKASATAAVSALDRAVKRKVIHPNNAARHKSRLAKRLNKAQAGAQPPASEQPAPEE